MLSVPRRTNLALFLPIHRTFWSMRPSSAWRHIEIATNWHASTCVHAETHINAPESTKGDEPRTSCGPRHSLVWQICTTLHFLHNSPCNGSKWPAWSPWISMSRMSGCKFGLVWCMSLAWLFKASTGLEEEEEEEEDGDVMAGYCCLSHLKMKRICHIKIGMGGSLQQRSFTLWSDDLTVTRWKHNRYFDFLHNHNWNYILVLLQYIWICLEMKNEIFWRLGLIPFAAPVMKCCHYYK